MDNENINLPPEIWERRHIFCQLRIKLISILVNAGKPFDYPFDYIPLLS